MENNLDPVYKSVKDAFHGMCALCSRPYDCFHEIIPKSRKRNWLVRENVVPLCGECHTEVHRVGSVKYRERLQRANHEVFRNLQRQDVFHLVSIGETVSD